MFCSCVVSAFSSCEACRPIGTLKPFGRLVVVQFGSLVVVQFLRFYLSAFTSCVTRTCEMRTGFAVNS